MAIVYFAVRLFLKILLLKAFLSFRKQIFQNLGKIDQENLSHMIQLLSSFFSKGHFFSWRRQEWIQQTDASIVTCIEVLSCSGMLEAY